MDQLVLTIERTQLSVVSIQSVSGATHLINIEAGTKWQPVCRKQYLMHFRDKNVCLVIQMSPKLVSKGLYENKSVLLQVMTWQQAIARPNVD